MSDPHDSNSPNGMPVQLSKWLNGQSKVTHLITIVVGVVVLVGIIAFSQRTNTPDREFLFGGRTLSEQELDGVEMSFSRAGLNGWQRDGKRISIPITSRSDYLAALRDASALPLSMRTSVQEAIDKTNIFESASQRVAREMHAKELDLGTKLAAFHEIRCASVEYDQGEREGLGRTRKQSASVVVCPEGTDPLTKSRVRTIQEFIRASYAGMSADDVVVIDTNADENSLHEDSPETTQRLERQARLEHEVREILAEYGDRKVSAHIDFSTPVQDAQAERASTINPASPLAQESQPDPLDDTPLIYQPKSRVAKVPSVGVAGTPPAAQASAQIETIVTATQPTVRLSIGLPETYYRDAWNQSLTARNPNRFGSVPAMTAEQRGELEMRTQSNIRAAILPTVLALGRVHPDNVLVDVWSFPNTSATANADFASLSMNWMGNNWQQAALVLIGLFGLWLAFRSNRNTHPKPIDVEQDWPRRVDEPLAQTPSIGPQVAPADNIIEADLLSLIEQNPEAAADVIRDWVAEAA